MLVMVAVDRLNATGIERELTKVSRKVITGWHDVCLHVTRRDGSRCWGSSTHCDRIRRLDLRERLLVSEGMDCPASR
jgi:hypothetical protein